MKYIPRTSAPDTNNKYYKHYQKGGLSICKIIDDKTGFTLPNCVGYAHGRMLESTNATAVNWKLPACNAEDWYLTAKANGLKVGKTPKVGSVIVWKSGNTKDSSDGCGHVAVVDAIDDDGTITISESGYGSYMFKTEKVKKPYARSGKQFVGFIYPLVEFETEQREEATEQKKELTATSYKDYTDGKSWYRVRKSFNDERSSAGSFSVWKNAFSRWNAVKSAGYHIYDNGGNQLD